MRKYLTELGLNMCAGNRMLVQQDFLNTTSQLQFNPHIYIIGKRPRISIDPKSIKIDGEKIYVDYFKQIGDQKIRIPIIGMNQLGTNNITVTSEYPYTELVITDNDTNEVFHQKAALQLMNFGPTMVQHLNLEVLYIGQSFGSDGSRNALDRLKNHSTLQNIYAEAINRSPDQEVWMLLCDFNEIMLTSFDGRSKEYATTMEEDKKHYLNVMENPISEQHKINFTEAALIKYFQPEYNKVFKDSFPNPAHSTYSECYDIDLNMVSVEINTDDLYFQLWNKHVSPKFVHFAKFPLHSRDDRKYMFEIT